MGIGSTVSGGSTGPTNGGALGGLGDFLGTNTNVQVNNPNADAYGQLASSTLNEGDQYGQAAAAAQGQQGTTINNAFQGQSQANLTSDRGVLDNAIMGEQSIVQNGGALAGSQFEQGLDQSIEAQQALANSSRGGAVARAGAMRQGQQNAGQQMAASTAQAAQIRAQAQQQALTAQGSLAQSLSGVDQSQYALEQGDAQQQAQLQQQQSAQNDSYSANLYGLQQTADANSLASQNGYNTAANQSDQTQLAQQQGNAAATMGVVSGVVGGASKAAALSDARAKENVHDGGSLADDFLKHVDPRAYSYRNPSTPGAAEGPQLGVMAQNLEKVGGGIGGSIVKDSPDGLKRVEMWPALSASMAGIGRLNERLEALEKGRKK